MTNRLAQWFRLQNRIFAGYLVTGLLTSGVVVMTYFGFAKTAEEFERFADFGRQAQDGLLLTRDIVDIQRAAQRFTYEGHPSSAEQVALAYGAIRRKLEDYRRIGGPERRRRIGVILAHLDSYYAAFDQARRQRERQSRLIDDELHRHAANLQALAERLPDIGGPAGSAPEFVSLRMFNTLLRIEQSAYRYFDSLDARHVDIAKAGVREARERLGALQRRFGPTAQTEFQAIEAALGTYERAFLEAVQRTRGYLYLVNVVMAAEAQEILYQARQISGTIDTEMNQIGTEITSTIGRVIDGVLVASLVVLGIFLLLSYLIGQSVARPIARLTEVFNRLSEGASSTDIPNYRIRDELGDLTRAARVFRDKNVETKQLLERYQELSGRLEIKVEERTRELASSNAELRLAKDAAESAARAKSAFLANMSHEIRTPLNAITGLTYLLRESGPNRDQLDAIERIGQASKALLALIGDILDFSKIEAGKLRIDEVAFDLFDLLEDAASLVGMRAAEKGLEFTIAYGDGLQARYRGDPLRVNQVLTNLLTNAVKFTDAGEVGVRVHAKAGTLVFCVWDTGIGLTDAQIGRLFRSFSQADDSTTRKHGGTGLGLAISKQLTELMGGRIDVESRAGEGSTFRVALPLVACEPAAAPTPPEPARALVVEPAERSRKILATELQRLGVDCVPTACVAEAVELAGHGEAFDVALFDSATVNIEAAARLSAALGPVPQVWLNSAAPGQAAAGVDRPLNLLKPVNPKRLRAVLAVARGAEAPAGEEPPGNPALLKARLRSLAGRRVLLAEDNAVNRSIVHGMLEGSGLVVEDAANGREAVTRFEQARDGFDLVLMDVQMPEMDGYEAATRIRAVAPDVPIVALTANAMAEHAEATRRHGMVDHLNKPIDVDVFFAALLKWIPPAEQAIAPAEEGREASPAASAEGVAVAPLDADAAAGRLGDNRRLLEQLLRQFAEDYRDTPAELLEAAQGDAGSAARTVHDLRGSSATLGMSGLGRLAGDYESAPRPEGLRALADELTRVLDAIARRRAHGGEKIAKRRRLDRKARDALFRELAGAVRSHRPRRVAATLRDFENAQLNDADAALFRALRPLLERHHYRDAQKLLETT